MMSFGPCAIIVYGIRPLTSEAKRAFYVDSLEIGYVVFRDYQLQSLSIRNAGSKNGIHLRIFVNERGPLQWMLQNLQFPR